MGEGRERSQAYALCLSSDLLISKDSRGRGGFGNFESAQYFTQEKRFGWGRPHRIGEDSDHTPFLGGTALSSPPWEVGLCRNFSCLCSLPGRSRSRISWRS